MPLVRVAEQAGMDLGLRASSRWRWVEVKASAARSRGSARGRSKRRVFLGLEPGTPRARCRLPRTPSPTGARPRACRLPCAGWGSTSEARSPTSSSTTVRRARGVSARCPRRRPIPRVACSTASPSSGWSPGPPLGSSTAWTIGANAIIEKKGAEVWVLTTAGFGDCLEIQRTNRTTLYDIKTLKPPSLCWTTRYRTVSCGIRREYVPPKDTPPRTRGGARCVPGAARGRRLRGAGTSLAPGAKPLGPPPGPDTCPGNRALPRQGGDYRGRPLDGNSPGRGGRGCRGRRRGGAQGCLLMEQGRSRLRSRRGVPVERDAAG